MSEDSEEEGKFRGRDVSEGWVHLCQLSGAGLSEEDYRIKLCQGYLQRSGGSAKGAVQAHERRRGAATPFRCSIVLQKQGCRGTGCHTELLKHIKDIT